jgi:hypothetical protein
VEQVEVKASQEQQIDSKNPQMMVQRKELTLKVEDHSMLAHPCYYSWLYLMQNKSVC